MAENNNNRNGKPQIKNGANGAKNAEHNGASNNGVKSAEFKPPSRAAAEKALLSVLQGDVKLERKSLILKSIETYGYPKEALLDRSCESLLTKLKSLTGIVINDMLDKKTLSVENRLYSAEEEESEDIAAEGKPLSEKSAAKKRRRRKKPQNHAAPDQKTKAYPDTGLGKVLSEADKKFAEFKKLKSDTTKAASLADASQKYMSHLKRHIVSAINEAGGEFFEQLSMKLLLAIYGKSVVKNELTAGPDDNGIDGILTIRDAFGFEEKVYFQSKTKLSERKNVSIKVARELLGVMRADRVTKGILITNSTFVKDTKLFAAKITPPLELVDNTRLFALMRGYKIGIADADGIPRIDDDFFLNIT